jgi:hypothetical protein
MRRVLIVARSAGVVVRFVYVVVDCAGYPTDLGSWNLGLAT